MKKFIFIIPLLGLLFASCDDLLKEDRKSVV